MEALFENDDDNSDFKKQIAFYIEEFGFLKDSFLMVSTFLDPRVRKFKKFKEKEILNVINNAKKYVKSFNNDHEIDPMTSGYTVWDRRNALLPRKVNMMTVLQQFDKHIGRLNKLNSQK